MLEGDTPVAVEAKTDDGQEMKLVVTHGVAMKGEGGQKPTVGETVEVTNNFWRRENGSMCVTAGVKIYGQMRDLQELGEQSRRFSVEHWRLSHHAVQKMLQEEFYAK